MIDPTMHAAQQLDAECRNDNAGIESAYRRGYFQGYFRALDAMDHGWSWTACEKFLYGLLYKWRFCKHRGQFTEPPIQRPKQ